MVFVKDNINRKKAKTYLVRDIKREICQRCDVDIWRLELYNIYTNL